MHLDGTNLTLYIILQYNFIIFNDAFLIRYSLGYFTLISKHFQHLHSFICLLGCGPNSTWLVSTRLDTTRHVRLCRASRDEPVEPCCSDMADGEQAIVLACTSLVVFMLLHTQILFVSSNKIN